jgi:endonuclease/exonuclease/phosphatase family metal-dependent hydrolase
MSLEPDVLVMPEFPRPGLEVPGRMVWAGPVRQRSTKGILAYADAPYGLRLLRQARRGDPRECLGLEVEGPTRFNLLAIWAKQDASTGTYVESLKRALKLFEAMFSAAAPTVVVGDLNSNSTFSRAGGGHDQFVKELDDLGLVSAYHRFTGEAQGQETQSTFRHMGSNRGRYHIDHCFIPKEWVQGIKVEVECPDGWRRLSDHSPLIVDVKLPAV